MALPTSTTIQAACPSCGARFDVLASMAGQRARCGACNAVFTVDQTAPAAPQTPATESSKPVEDEELQYIGFECRVCQTRLYGRPSQIGQQMNCPDCGARTVVPPPPPPKKKNIPAALEGEQYELWDVNEHPLPSDLVARQPKLVTVSCRNCSTLIYAKEIHVGKQVACPDCGTKQIVPAPSKPKVKLDVLARDVDTPKVDPTKAPGERPAAISPEMQARIDEESKHPVHELGDKLDVRGRPVVPRWPLIKGIVPFPFYAGCRSRWAALTFGLMAIALLFSEGIPAWVNWQGDQAGGMAAMLGLAETMFGAVFAILWIAAGSNIFIAIVSESSEGHNHISEWPALNFISSMAEMLPVLVAVTFAAAPGWAIGHLAAGDLLMAGLLAGCTLILAFPLSLLSQLAATSTFEVIDLRVLVAMFRCWPSMILFYIESVLLAAVCVAATVAMLPFYALIPFVLTPLYVYCMMVYARMLGRLGWKLADSMPVMDELPPE